jgi:5,10-methylene-tetrahydrofolate dehydrogenase/methenyl tetrahydrofolate cyclohydrolase
MTFITIHFNISQGGVGPMTVAMLMRNTFIAAKKLAVERR